MNITEARELLTHRHSRVHNPDGGVYIGLSLEDAEAIAALLPIIDTSVPRKPEKAIEAKPEPVKVPEKKVAKKKTRERRK